MINHAKSHPLTLVELKRGRKAKIVAIAASSGLAHKLSTLGLRIGASLTKISAFAMRGPVAVKTGQTTIALGHSMAQKILVEPHP